MEVSGQLHAPAMFRRGGTAPSTHDVGGWVGPVADLDIMEKGKTSCPYQELNSSSSVIQLIA
jgi:hypothetical protein